VRALDQETLLLDLGEKVKAAYKKRAEEDFAGFDFHEVEKMVLLQMIDQAWKNHLYDLDHMKKYIHLRAYAQKDPKVEYQRESFALFNVMLDRIREQTVEYIFRVQAPRRPPPPPPTAMVEGSADGQGPSFRPASILRPQGFGKAPAPAAMPKKIGRNDPCPCGSKKKYKKCCGA
jgi:preprotein translocase subunit SecA